MAVPLQNIYYLLCYAWNRLDARTLTDVSAVQGNRVENLLAKVLCEGVAHLIHLGVHREYATVTEDARTLRGKLLLTDTVRRSLLPSGRVVCEYDELTHDVPHNRVLKAAMRELLALPDVEAGFRRQLRRHCQLFGDVLDVPLTPQLFRQLQLQRNVARYTFLVNVCQLVALSLLPDPVTGERRFRPFTTDDACMGGIFQEFIFRFLAREQGTFQVSRPHVPWQASAPRADDLAWLPRMETDVVLQRPGQRVIIDTKYYATPYQERYDTRKLISEHLYQLLTYVSQSRTPERPAPVGVLLYARSGVDYALDYRLGDATIAVRTLDLDQPWQAIHRGLLALVADIERLDQGTAPDRSSANARQASIR